MNKKNRSGGACRRSTRPAAFVVCIISAMTLRAAVAAAQTADPPPASPTPQTTQATQTTQAPQTTQASQTTQTPQATQTPQTSQTPQPVDVEVFHDVQIVSGPKGNPYPPGESADGHEGWVVLNMMIDPHGKPYEVMVQDSSGNPSFEKAALKAVNQVTFAPAHRGDTPIDSSFTFKFKFAMREPQKGASPEFIAKYKRFTHAVVAGDKVAADAILPTLVGENLYELAFQHYSRAYYFQKWGTPAEQLRELVLAVAGEKRPDYLPKDAFVTALTAIISLQLKAQDYGSALDTWSVLEPLVPPERRAKFTSAVDQIKALQSGSQPLRYAAEIGERGSAETMLFRNRFGIDVVTGSVEEIKLRCAKQYLFFKYQPGVDYSIGKAKDQCSIEIVGQPGTKFFLTQ